MPRFPLPLMLLLLALCLPIGCTPTTHVVPGYTTVNSTDTTEHRPGERRRRTVIVVGSGHVVEQYGKDTKPEAPVVATPAAR